MKKNGAFTLLELLVVIGIIIILAALLFPIINKGTEKARDVRCQANLKSLWRGAMNFVNYNPEHAFPQYWVTNGAWRGAGAIAAITGSVVQGNVKGYRWYDSSMTVTTTNPATGLVTVNRSIVIPSLFKFVDSDIRIYLCPTFARQVRTLGGVTNAYRNYLINRALPGTDYLMITNSISLPVFSETFMPTNTVVGALDFVTTNTVEIRRYHGGKLIGWNAFAAQYTNGTANIIFMDGHIGKL